MADASALDEIRLRYRELKTGLRADLRVTRQVNHGDAVYVLFDSVGFRAHRLSNQDYQVVGCLSTDHSLEASFRLAISRGLLKTSQESEFYQFVAKLDSLGLVSTSSQSGETLFRRRVASDSSRRTGISNILFLTVPLSNPDHFLERTVGLFRPLFTRVALSLWVIMAIGASATIFSKWDEFLLPLNNLLALQNLMFMSAAFLLLKVWHELGHGYACKHFGGRVPEMGCKLIVGMPLAYVDATSAWSFPRRWNRIVVMLGGMYFESLIALPAVFIWASQPDSAVGAFSYQLILMAGVATLFFNANPLMRYDGYFVLSELTGMPNLRSRAKAEVNDTFKHVALGLPRSSPYQGRQRKLLFAFGVASTLYYVSLTLSIAAMVAYRFHVVGLVLASMQLGGMIWKTGNGLRSYLLNSMETEPVRGRARLWAYGLAIGAALLLLFLPVPSSVRVPGVVTSERMTVVRAAADGILSGISADVSKDVSAGELLLVMRNIDAQAASLAAALTADQRERHAVDPQLEQREKAKLRLAANASENARRHAEATVERLAVRAPHDGKLAFIVTGDQIGTRVEKGTALATIVRGQLAVRGWLTARQLAESRLQPGDVVKIRLSNAPGKRIRGRVVSLAAAKANALRDVALSTSSNGPIATDADQRPLSPTYQVRIAVKDSDCQDSPADARVYLSISRKYEPLGFWMARNLRNFVNAVMAG